MRLRRNGMAKVARWLGDLAGDGAGALALRLPLLTKVDGNDISNRP